MTVFHLVYYSCVNYLAKVVNFSQTAISFLIFFAKKKLQEMYLGKLTMREQQVSNIICIFAPDEQ
jgi:hypothetical protein